jgi:hypothetical protein
VVLDTSQVSLRREPGAFYSMWRLKDVERHLLKFLKQVQHRLQNTPLAPYVHFPLQEPAFEFARSHEQAEGLR